MKSNLAIYLLDKTQANQALATTLAKRLNFPIILEADKNYDYWLLIDKTGLQLQKTLASFKPIIIDFEAPKLKKRYASKGQELLVKAISNKPQENFEILDATAGFGKDAAILAAQGYSITLLERSPLLYLLLEDALKRIKTNNPTLAARLKLIETDSLLYLSKHQKKFDVIYLDPMFPPRTKTARVKKEMEILQEILGKEKTDETRALFELARKATKKRVIIKRPRQAKWIIDEKPNASFFGRAHRFDVYLASAPAPAHNDEKPR